MVFLVSRSKLWHMYMKNITHQYKEMNYSYTQQHRCISNASCYVKEVRLKRLRPVQFQLNNILEMAKL